MWPALIIDTTLELEHQNQSSSVTSELLAELTLGTRSSQSFLRARITRWGQKAVGRSRRAPTSWWGIDSLPLNTYTVRTRALFPV